MKKELSTEFNTRQYMQANLFEIFYYNDMNLTQISFHQHDYYEFYFFLEGDVSYQVDDQVYPLQFGDYLLIPPGTSHGPVFHSREIPYRRFILWISRDYYDQLCSTASDFSYGFDHVKRIGNYCFHPAPLIRQSIQGKLIDLLEEKNTSKAFLELNLSLMSASLLLYINRLVYEQVHQVSPAYENVLYLNLCDYINNHLEEDLSLDRLADFFYVSKYHISHLFKDHMGISLHQYIIKKRLHASKNGILSGIPLKTLIYQYGFHDYTSFYRAFKKEFGLSPTEFREQHQLPEQLHFFH